MLRYPISISIRSTIAVRYSLEIKNSLPITVGVSDFADDITIFSSTFPYDEQANIRNVLFVNVGTCFG